MQWNAAPGTVVFMSVDKVIVVGAGPAGLATAAQLRRAHMPAVVLEQAEAIGAAWRGRYERLRLNSSRWYSTLPGGPPYPRGTGLFPARDEVVRYLDAYAERHALDVRVGVQVQRLERERGRWRVETSQSDMLAEHVVIAGGYERRPFVPAWAGRARYRREVLHAAAYRSPGPYAGRDVLVVGPGCSGAEIAHDLAEGGAARVRLAVRTPPNIILRDPLGAPLAALFLKLPPRWGDSVMRFVRRKKIGDLTEFGLPVPAEGVVSRFRRLHVAPMIVDPEVIDAVRDRRIAIVPAVEGFDENGVLLSGGERIEPDAVIAATGYRPGLEPLLGHLDVLDDHGAPRVIKGEAAPGLRFVGYDPRPGQIRYMGTEAERAARAIARTARRSPRRTLQALPSRG